MRVRDEKYIILVVYLGLFLSSLILFIADSILHLVRRYRGRDAIGDVTKIFLMPLLFLTLFLAFKTFRFPLSYGGYVFLVAICYTLGDISLLIKAKSIFFYIGAFLFTLGHIFYIIYFTRFGITLWGLFLGIAVFGGEYAMFLFKVRSTKVGLTPYALYAGGVLALSIAVSMSYDNGSIAAWVFSILGVVFFGLSDARIAYNRCGYKESSDFFIMIFYILANVFLALGVWFINVPLGFFII